MSPKGRNKSARYRRVPQSTVSDRRYICNHFDVSPDQSSKILSDCQNFSCEKDLIICNLLVVSIIDECGQGVVRLRERTRASSMYVRERLLCTGRFGPTLIRSNSVKIKSGPPSATTLTELAPITSDQIRSDQVRAQDSKSKSRYNMATYEGTGMSMSTNMSRTNLNTT